MAEQTPTYDFEYLKVLEDAKKEGDLTETPPHIKKMIGGINMLYGKYKGNPTKGNLQSLTTADDNLIEEIEKHIENSSDAPEEKPAEKPAETKPVEKPVEVPKPEEKIPEPTPTPEPPTPEPPKEPTLEERVRAELDGNKISSSKLKSILGKLNTWSGEEKVGSLKLKKAMFQDTYIAS